ncbi:MAG TPA: alpha/beta hydrolase [Hyphomicrobiaceae bacterium]|jgi:dienelactone hydrolase|nr:alpha/beta hydrolase [Hyphomicrobiaceae bacterium]
METAAHAAIGLVLLWGISLSSATGAFADTPIPRAALVREEARLEATYGESQVIEHQMLWVRPAGNGPFPLAVVTHGTDEKTLRETRPESYIGIAEEMARRGWAAAVVMRRGYGRSGGRYAEPVGSTCRAADYVTAGNATADDLETMINALSRMPVVDARQIVALGQSSGGLGVTALAGRAISGLKGVVSFSGGRGARPPNADCEERLVTAYATFGSSAKVPSVWLYAEGDSFFRPELIRFLYKTYNDNGGRATLHLLTGIEGDGHTLFRRRNIPRWREPLDAFLRSNELPTWTLGPPDHCPGGTPPVRLGETGLRLWKDYLCGESYKAFAYSQEDDRVGYAFFHNSMEAATKDAIRFCVGDRPERKCRVVATDDQ